MLKGIYETFVLEQKVQPVGLFEAGIAKLDITRPHIGGGIWETDELISMATVLSRSDLRKVLRDGKDKDEQPAVDEAEELRKKWGVEVGQIWVMGKHQLICGDCNNPAVFAKAMRLGQPDMILTDPPYGMGLDTDYSKMPSTKDEGNKTYAPIISDNQAFRYNNYGLECNEEFWFGADYYHFTLPDGGSWLVWDKREQEKFDAMFGSGFELIWSKTPHKRDIIRCNNTLFSGEPEARGKLHPTIKPTKVITWLLTKYSKYEQVVIDMYAGAGTTIIACENLNRVCTAIEIVPKYVAVTLQRYYDTFERKPELLGSL
jgi:DNA modification methylase